VAGGGGSKRRRTGNSDDTDDGEDAVVSAQLGARLSMNEGIRCAKKRWAQSNRLSKSEAKLLDLAAEQLSCSLFLSLSHSFSPSPSLSFSLCLSFPLSLSPIGFFGVWFSVLGVC